MKLKKGDIVLNKWAGHVECRYFIFTGKSGRYSNGVEFVQGKLKNIQYYTKSLDDTYHDGTPAFEVVGHTNAFEVMKTDLKIAQEK